MNSSEFVNGSGEVLAFPAVVGTDPSWSAVAHSPQLDQLFAALAAAQAELEPALKTSTNDGVGNRYASLAECWRQVRACLPRHGLAVVQVGDRLPTGEPALRTVLGHASGQWFSGVFALVFVESRRANPAQALGSAIAYISRYSLQAITGLVSEKDDDGQAAGPSPRDRDRDREPYAPARSGGQFPSRPATAAAAAPNRPARPQAEPARDRDRDRDRDRERPTCFVPRDRSARRPQTGSQLYRVLKDAEDAGFANAVGRVLRWLTARGETGRLVDHQPDRIDAYWADLAAAFPALFAWFAAEADAEADAEAEPDPGHHSVSHSNPTPNGVPRR